MNLLKLLALANRYRPVVGLVGLAVYHVAAKSDPEAALQDLAEAAVDLGLPLPISPPSTSS